MALQFLNDGVFTGKVGIGTAGPAYKLDVNSSAFVGARIESTAAGYAPASILLESGHADSRGQGIYQYNSVSKNSWFSGVPYSTTSDDWVIAHKLETTAFNSDVAQMGNALFCVNDNGNVGIGTTSPSEKLHTYGSGIIRNKITSTDNQSIIELDGTGGQLLNRTGDLLITNLSASNSLIFRVGSSLERMRILANGNVGIGTTSPSEKLSVDGNVQITTGGNTYLNVNHGNVGFIKFTDTSIATPNQFLIQHNYAQDNDFRIARGTGGQDFVIDSTGKVGIGTDDPQSKLQVAGGIQMADDTDTASASKVGTMRYRTGTEYVEVDGVELVTNGDFATNTDWNLNLNWTISGGTCNADGTSNNDINQAQVLGVVGQSYRIIYVISAYTQGSISARIGSGVTDLNTGTGTFSQVVTATTTDRIRMNIASSFIGSVDSLSIVKVTAEDASYADMCMQTGASTYEWVNIVRNTY